MNSSGSLDVLLPLLRCPLCHSPKPIVIRPGRAEWQVPVALHDRHLLCTNCNSQYPVTEDFIPLMWDADVKNFYCSSKDNQQNVISAVGANIAVYDSISDNYQLYTRKNLEVAKRIQNAARLILRGCDFEESRAQQGGNRKLIHLDYGCGPGNVLGWLREFGLTQIGLDVSIGNLRNARKHTGCLVVCGSAANIPFADGTIDLVTESSALHHISDWRAAVNGSLRICKKPGGVIVDSEPSRSLLAYSRLAVMLLDARFPAYKVLSYFRKDKYIFRNMKEARLNMQAEIHAQPGTGFPLDELEALFKAAHFDVDIILSPTTELVSKPRPNWKRLVLDLLSARNPWNPKYGSFTAIATC